MFDFEYNTTIKSKEVELRRQKSKADYLKKIKKLFI